MSNWGIEKKKTFLSIGGIMSKRSIENYNNYLNLE
jgi:hypothetical protein